MKLKPFLIAIGILVLLVGLVAGVKALQIGRLIASGEEKGGPPAETVSTAPVTTERWDRSVESVGSMRAVQGSDLSTELSGVVTKIYFENGQEVKEGDLLVELDTQTEEANLRSAEAEADLARTVYDRTRMLRANNTVPQSEMDTAESNLRKMNALVEQLKSTIRKKQVRAPFSGQVGIREVNLGQFVDNGDKVVSLQSLDPIFVDFLLPQQLLSQVAPGSRLRVITDVYPGKSFEGELTAVNAEIDPVTRNIRLQGTLQNPEGLLRPGMFGRIILSLGEAEEVTAIPVTAIVAATYGDSVFVVTEKADEEGNTQLLAEQRFIRTGRTEGDFVAVTEGLQPGETVVSAGAFKLRNGSSIEVNNDMAPRPERAPRPRDS
jgi:membrane fusion protein (multidrug efflux system)